MNDVPVSQFQIGDYFFDPDTGAVSGNGDATEVQRLGPQPTKLLCLLIERQPNVLTKEEIQQALWPGVVVDYEASLHFCMHQVRAAFADSASSPKIIETVPRRGYRLIAEVKTALPHSSKNGDVDVAPFDASGDGKEVPPSVDDSITEPLEVQPTVRSHAKKPLPFELLAWLAAGLVVIAAAWWASGFIQGDQPQTGDRNAGLPRIAIMPFQTDQEGYGSLGDGSFAIRLLKQFSDSFGKTMEVVGPTTTLEYDGNPPRFQNLLDEVEPAFVIHAKYIPVDAESSKRRVLFEIIRGTDGAHLWVEYFDVDEDLDVIQNQIDEALRKILAAATDN